MSKFRVAVLAAVSTLMATQALAQQYGQPQYAQPQYGQQPQSYAPGYGAPPQAAPYPSKRRDVCGSPITGKTPDVMTYDSSTGTQVFVGGGRDGATDVAAYNVQTGSVAGLSGDLSRPGLVSSCSVDGLTRESYGVSSDRPGHVALTGRDDRGERYQFTRADGRVESWDPRYDNQCFRSGSGLFGPPGPGDRRC